jgi:methylmalonyl-CoA/ethylmalonyl-CoA epimerase
MEWKLSQVCIVVNDLDKAIEYYSSVFGFGPFHKMKFPQLKVEVRGELRALDVSLALTRLGGLWLELIQADPGENIYWEFFQRHGEGLHHLGFDVSNIEVELSRAREKGIEVLMSGKVGKVGFAYLDSTEWGGVIMELIQRI